MKNNYLELTEMAEMGGDRRIKSGDGTTYIASSQRADGTWRKARKVKEGYIPQEEQPKYEARGMAKNNERVPVGLHPSKLKPSTSRPKPPIHAIHAPKAPITPQDHIQRKIGNVQKKIDDISKLEDRLKKGEALELNQMEKIKKKDELQGEIDKLTEELNKL